VGIDLMGSDASPEVLLHAVHALIDEYQNAAHLTVFGTHTVLRALGQARGVERVETPDVIRMEDAPLAAVRRKKNSSICLGMKLLQQKQLDAFVSAGNTGALFASANMCLPILPGIDRPALLTLLPTQLGEVAVLDVGANVTWRAHHLLQFALMGAAYQKCCGVEHPSIGLLNIGTEAKKGTPEIRHAYALLQGLGKSFLGNIEGRDVFQGRVDVLVTDGFTGNVFLKTAEGIAAFILEQIEAHAAEETAPGIGSFLSALRQRLHHAEYPGAFLCGIDGIVVKCHGDASPRGLINGVKGALRLIQYGFLDKIKAFLAKDLPFL
jgi:glycerol-3-phosphate acyltransferase PlsX